MRRLRARLGPKVSRFRAISRDGAALAAEALYGDLHRLRG